MADTENALAPVGSTVLDATDAQTSIEGAPTPALPVIGHTPPTSPKESEPITREQIAKLAPQERKGLSRGIHVAILRRVETAVAGLLYDAATKGAVVEGAFVEKPDLRDVVPFVVVVESDYLPAEIRAAWKAQDRRAGVWLRDRETLARELRTREHVEPAKPSRPMRRGKRPRRDRPAQTTTPWAPLGDGISKRLCDGQPGAETCHYAVVVGPQVAGEVFMFRFDLKETLDSLVDAKKLSPDGTPCVAQDVVARPAVVAVEEFDAEADVTARLRPVGDATDDPEAT